LPERPRICPRSKRLATCYRGTVPPLTKLRGEIVCVDYTLSQQ